MFFIAGPLAWLDPKTDQVKLSGVVSFVSKSGCDKPGLPSAYADVANQLEWINKVTKNCNERTCQAKGNCMRKEELVQSVIDRFETMTPHRFQAAEPVKENSTGEEDNPNTRYLAYGKK